MGWENLSDQHKGCFVVCCLVGAVALAAIALVYLTAGRRHSSLALQVNGPVIVLRLH